MLKSTKYSEFWNVRIKKKKGRKKVKRERLWGTDKEASSKDKVLKNIYVLNLLY